MRTVVAAIVFVLVVAGAGCHFVAGDYPCESTANCPSPMTCVAGTCVEATNARDAGTGVAADDDGGRALLDGGRSDADAGFIIVDGGFLVADGGFVIVDGGLVAVDGGLIPVDGGVLAADGGAAPDDAGTAAIDAGNVDGGGALDLVVTGTVAACAPVDLEARVAGISSTVSDVACTASPRTLDGPTTFTGGADPWTSTSSGGDVSIQTWPNGFPSCPTTGQFRRFIDGNACWMELGDEIDATGYEALAVRFVVGFDGSPSNGDDLVVEWCCGSGCNPSTEAGIVQPAVSGGSDECRTVTIPLSAAADDCGALQVRFSWPGSDGRAGVDDVEVIGTPILSPLVAAGTGVYATSVTSCIDGTIDVTCTMASAGLADTEQIVVP